MKHSQSETVQAIIHLEVPEYQIGQEVSVYFKDTMYIKSTCEKSKTGHWIGHREHCEMNNLRPSGLGSYFWCSECDCGIDAKDWHRNNYNYCPNCGAKMESEDKE